MIKAAKSKSFMAELKVMTLWPRIKFLSPILASSFLWLNAAWPISMSPDSTDIWNQVKTGSFNDAHPILYGYFIKAISLNGSSLVSVSIFQLIMTLILLFQILKILNPNRSLQRNSYIVSFLLLTPFFGAMFTTLWKDVPHTIFILLGLLQIRKVKSFVSITSAFSVALLTIGASLRHEGPIVLLLCAILVLILQSLRREIWNNLNGKTIALLLIFTAFLSVSLHQIVLNASNTPATSRSLSGLGATGALGYTTNFYPNLVTPEGRVAIAKISSGESFLGFQDCKSINAFFYSPGFDHSEYEKQWKTILREYVRSFPSAWPHLIYAQMCRTSAFLPPPISMGSGYKNWTILSIYTPNQQGIVSASPVPEARNLIFYWRAMWESRGQLIAWPGLLGLYIFLRHSRTRNSKNEQNEYFKSAQIIGPYLFSQLLFLAIFAPAQDNRYALIVQWIAVILIVSDLETRMRRNNRR
jgi:hypothetical protein